MKTIQDDDGNVYVLKSDMENIIKERISKVSARAQEAEEAQRNLQSQLEDAKKGAKTSDVLSQQVEEYREKLEQSKNRYERYVAISKHGLVDEDMVEAIEWAYEKSQSKVAKKERQGLNEWLQKAVENPENAPMVLRPHLQQLQTQVETVEAVEPPEATPGETMQQFASAPNVNRNAMPAQEPPDLITRGLQDPDFYAQNRDAIMKQWKNRGR